MKTNFSNIIFARQVNMDLALLVFRILAAFSLMRTHGIPKIMNFSETVAHIPDPMGFGSLFSTYYAVFTNVICALLVILGLGTRIASFFIFSLTLSGLMLVHFNDPANIQDVPLIYSIVFGFIATVGPGKYSLDEKLFENIKG